MKPGGATILAIVLIAAGLAAGCGAPATFVSDVPPPDVETEIHFDSTLARVRSAIRVSALRNGLTIDEPRSTTAVVVASLHQLPYVGEGVLEPASGRLPFYVLTARLSSTGATGTDVAIGVEVRHVGDRGAPYEWRYPTDVLRSVLDDARKTLRERARCRLPDRYRPTARWEPPRGR